MLIYRYRDIIYKFNTTTNFVNLHNFSKRLLYLRTVIIINQQYKQR